MEAARGGVGHVALSESNNGRLGHEVPTVCGLQRRGGGGWSRYGPGTGPGAGGSRVSWRGEGAGWAGIKTGAEGLRGRAARGGRSGRARARVGGWGWGLGGRGEGGGRQVEASGPVGAVCECADPVEWEVQVDPDPEETGPDLDGAGLGQVQAEGVSSRPGEGAGQQERGGHQGRLWRCWGGTGTGTSTSVTWRSGSGSGWVGSGAGGRVWPQPEAATRLGRQVGWGP